MQNGGIYSVIYGIVARIPAGKVMTYGQIALICGRPGAARTVGYAMSTAPAGLPCHRVVNRRGDMAPGDIFCGESAQREALQGEGVSFLDDGRVDLSTSLWSYTP